MFKPRRFAYLPVLGMLLFTGCSGPDEPTGVPEAVIRENTLGTAYLGQQEWSSAADAFQRGLAIREQEPLLLSNLAVALMQDGKPDEAETYLRQAIAIDPQHPHANYNLGLIESNRGNFAAAAAHFERVAAHDPDDVLTQYQLGIAYASLDRSADATAALGRALQLEPDHVSSLYALGRELVKQGNRDEGRELIARSQAIRARSGLDTAVGSQYGEQGFYALGADYPGDALAAPEAIDLTFGFAAGDQAAAESAWTLSRTAPTGETAVIVANDQRIGPMAASNGFAGLPGPDPDGGKLLAIAAGDGDDDGIVELYALVGGDKPRLAIVEQDDAGRLTRAASGLVSGTLAMPAAITAADLVLVDREHDGDLDVFACWAAASDSGCAIATNDGSGRFTVRPSAEHGFTLDLDGANFIEVTLSDIDNDRDIDLVVAATSAIHVLTNQRDGSFAAQSPIDPGMTALAGMALADVDKDGWMDAVIGGAEGLRRIPNRRGRLGAPESLVGVTAAVRSLVVFDADNDGFLDVAIGTPEFGARAFRNLGTGRWSEATDWFATDAAFAPAAAFDADGDGDLDLVGKTGSGLAWFENSGGNANRWISVESRGIGDNQFGIGAKVEVLAGALRQKFEITGPLPVHAGLGTRAQVDSVRHLWPSGVLQDEVRLASGSSVEVKQLDRKGTSCPILYVWSEGEWRFVTDFLGGSAIGYQAAPGVFSNPDTDEYVKLDAVPSADADGNLRLRVNNQLQEIIWYDKLELIAVDHPEGTELFPNERLMPGPPWPDFTVFISGEVRPIASAHDVSDHTDWTAALAQTDRRYVENFGNLRFKGYAETHTLELDLGAAGPDERIVLLLDGWIDYADSTANVGAAQAGLSLTPPVLTVADGRGGWRDTGHLMGFPAGLPKTMAVDLTGLFPSTDHRIRIETNMRIYWDRARVMTGGEDIDYRIQRLAPFSAELRYGGFPQEASSDGRRPFGYDPANVRMSTPWKAHVGRYTAFGDVTALIRDIDDRLVMTRAGDEIELVFRSPGPVPQGQTRSYLMFADGFGKDMDPNSAANYLAGPMPFHGMPTYPYPADVAPPVDISDTLTRAVPPAEKDPAGALPLGLAPVLGTH